MNDSIRPGITQQRSAVDDNFALLRLLLALMVLFSHSFDLIDFSRAREPLDRLFHTYYAGDLGADGFFLISGFMVLSSWRRDPQPLRFLARRALRIYPAFMVATLVCGLVLGPIFGGGVEHYFSQFRPGAFVLGMLLLREPLVPPVFLGSPYADVDGTLWMIQFQFMCYVVVALAGVAGLVRKRLFWWLLWLCATSLNLFYADALNDIRFRGSRLLLGDEPASFVRFLTFFCSGALVYWYRERIRYSSRGAAVAFVALVAALFRFDTAKLMLPTAGAYLLFGLAFRPLPEVGAIEGLRSFVRHCDLSYGIFLFGWPAQQVLIRLLQLRSPWLLMLLAAPCAAACAFVSWHLVEQRFLGLKPRAGAHSSSPETVRASLLR